MSRNDFDVAVIGSGIGGLTCGAFLARAGCRVAVFESHTKIGGYAHTFTRRPYVFESGIHSVPLADDGLIMHLLRLLGVEDTIETVSHPSIYSFSVPGFSFALPVSRGLFRDALIELFPSCAGDVDRILNELSVFYETLAVPIFSFETDFREEDTAFLSRYHNVSFADFLCRCTDNENLRQVFYAMWPYAGCSPQSAAAVFYAMMFSIHLREGSHYIRGGFSRLADALAGAITSRGGAVYTRSRVTGLTAEENRIKTIVLADGTQVSCGTCVSNISPLDLHGSLMPDNLRKKMWLRRIGNLTPSIASVISYYGLRSDITSLMPHTINFWFDSADHEHLYRSALCGVPPKDPDHLILLRTVPDEKPGTLTLMHFVPPDMSIDWKSVKPVYAEKMKEHALRLYPGLGDCLDREVVGSPSTCARYTGNTGGALYGFENTADMYGEAKIPPRTSVPNCYQVGHWGKPGGGLWNVMYNAYAASRMILLDS